MMHRLTVAALLALVPLSLPAQAPPPPPILDMHLHAFPADGNGPPPFGLCIPILRWVEPFDPGRDGAFMPWAPARPPCPDPIWSALTDDEVMRGTIAVAQRRNLYGVLGGRPDRVRRWMAAAPGRFIPSLEFQLGRDDLTPDAMRRLFEDGSFDVLGEVSHQYAGVGPDDPRLEPYWALAEQLDVPVQIHMGEGPVGAAVLVPTYRARLSNPFLLEEVLARHPRLRVSVMHYGSPLIGEMVAMLGAYPQLYVELGGIQWFYPRPYFYGQLRQLVEAGFGTRVMFGSDQMNWPGVIEPALAIVEEAPFLSEAQKRDILYNNAARFLRLSEETIARHHGR